AKVIEYKETIKDEKHVLVRIDDCYGERRDMDCLFKDGEHVNGSVISLYIQLMRHEEHGNQREGGKVYLENTWWSQVLKAHGEEEPEKLGYNREDTVQSRVNEYLKADMVFLPINITLCHWYLAVVIPSKGEIQILDSFGENMSSCQHLRYTLIGMEKLMKHIVDKKQLDTSKWPKGIEVSSWELQHIITNKMQEDGCSCGLWMINFMEYWTGTTLSDHVTQWVRSTQPHPISLTVSKIINILREGKQMDHDSFNMAIRILANNKYKMLNKPTYHLMDLKFAEVTKFGRDP
ncbi:hypothetical protein BDA96_08G144500, partial [Sorghum bicolor]